MPCNSDYLEPNTFEKETQRAANLVLYIHSKLSEPTEEWIHKLANDIYAQDNRIVPLLCAEIKQLSSEQKEDIIYDAHNPTSRDLADWWETHQEADRQRTASEQFAAENKRLRTQALSKLTTEERMALDLE